MHLSSPVFAAAHLACIHHDIGFFEHVLQGILFRHRTAETADADFHRIGLAGAFVVVVKGLCNMLLIMSRHIILIVRTADEEKLIAAHTGTDGIRLKAAVQGIGRSYIGICTLASRVEWE